MEKKKSPLVKLLLSFIVIIALVLGIKYAFFNGSYNSGVSNASSTDDTASLTSALPDDSYGTVVISAPKGTINALLADTDAKMELGLSYRDSIANNSGMLFQFNEPGVYDFWMKDMHFPLDIVWIDADKNVIGIETNLSPDTYPNTVSPDSDMAYALEIPAGSAALMGIATGTILSF